jgi:hypothetical protein
MAERLGELPFIWGFNEAAGLYDGRETPVNTTNVVSEKISGLRRGRSAGGSVCAVGGWMAGTSGKWARWPQGNQANKAKYETAIGTQAVERADEDMRDGQCGGQSRKQVFNTEITEKGKATEGTERII